MQGNMAAVSAEGNGNRFIIIAVETSKPFRLTILGRIARRCHSPGPRCGVKSR